MDSKPFWASKTLWANAIVFIAAISGALGLDLGLDAETQVALVGGVMAVVNIILRLTTTTSVTGTCDGS
jgi:hypothetical protein